MFFPFPHFSSVFFAKLSLQYSFDCDLRAKKLDDSFMLRYINYTWFMVELLFLFLRHGSSILAPPTFGARQFFIGRSGALRHMGQHPGVYPLHTSSSPRPSSPPPCDHQNCLQTLPHVLWKTT